MKLFYFKDKEKPVCYYNTDKQVIIPDEYKEKELRGIWVSNVLNIDMPTTKDLKKYEDKCHEIIKTCKEYNINTLFFQVRTSNDAFYQSDLNPYSRFLTGKEGEKPPYDVFKWFLELAKSANIEVHAWCNPYRVSCAEMTLDEYLATCDDLNFAKKHPDALCEVAKGSKFILNPAREDVKQFVVDSLVEIASKYDVAGVHIDDYFYPYEGLKEGFDDSKEFANRIDKSMSLDEFRRFHITDVIKRLHKGIKQVNKNQRFGVSPFGIWMNKANDERGSNTDPKCSQSFDNQYADTYAWVKEEIIDYIVPQLYWDLGHPIAPFADLCDWWANLCKGSNVDLYIGHGAYRLGSDGQYQDKDEVVNQLKYANQYETVKGNVFFTYHSFIDKGKIEDGMKELKKTLKGK
ncbi:family 10 glycosylhydrolase [Acholeplasma sp. OttesenSCG-928-E16]|nr:family 10 glycosylhydrolase [Acholeplasma sp. OttesenSCG-928-E16]